LTPSFMARLRPSLVRSRMRSRSNSAIAATCGSGPLIYLKRTKFDSQMALERGKGTRQGSAGQAGFAIVGRMNARLSDIEPRFICAARGKRGADGRTAIFKPVTSLCRGPTQRSHHGHSPHRHGNLGSHGIRDRLAARRCQRFPDRKDGTWRD
jgi:hypothetical protein